MKAGIRSKIWSMMFPDRSFRPRAAQDCAFRVILLRSAIKRDPQLAHLVKTPAVDIWLGLRRLVVAYNTRDMELLNVMICGPGSGSVGVWNGPASLEGVKEECADSELTVRSILNRAEHCPKWTSK